jgi:WD40 repeat protein
VTSLSFGPDGKRVVSGSSDRTAKVWDAATVTGEIAAKEAPQPWEPDRR